MPPLFPPPDPPLPVGLLPQAASISSPQNNAAANRNLIIFFLCSFFRSLKPAPNRRTSPNGRLMAYSHAAWPSGVCKDATGAVVEMVRVEVPLPAVIFAGLKLHVGPNVFTGATLQVSAMSVAKPFCAVAVIVEVSEVPALMVAAEGAPAEKLKSGAGAA